ncbi:hypothetical protein [Nocardioides cavernaquae]|uniref:Uncharacterized protein n=1 Tax=Nocardioides cavernaquae TaxID=2321396 RepID=A0A3A5HB66_9ACTN|nr:hypothetical protein [Nocardioides cavernaquae]RJS47331.1 hypothetical protein D4739_14655 [Nocardioides cavernaquae]
MDGFSADPAAIEAVADLVASLVPALADAARAVGALSPDAGTSTSELGGGLRDLGGQATSAVVRLEALAGALRGTATSYAATDSATGLTIAGGLSTGRAHP